MDYISITGIIWALTLVAWSALPPEPENANHPMKSIKNWCFAMWWVIMLFYSSFNFLEWGPIFFIFLQCLVIVASILMMLNTPDEIDTPIIVICWLALITWSLYLFEWYNTIFFILGLIWIGLWYVFDMATIRRGVALTLGSILIALFSYIEASWIFFWLNIFFAIFSGYHLIKRF